MNTELSFALQDSYNRIAQEYATRIYGELAHKPFDRELLERFADRVRRVGQVCDLGCGPGHVARYLHDLGVDIFGMDISPGMVEKARELNPDIEFRQGDMRSLPVEENSWAGITAFYSLIHIPRDAMISTLRELWRVLLPGGVLFLAFHIGEADVHRDELWGHPVSLDFLFFTSDEMRGYLEAAEFTVEMITEREPYPDVEHQSRGCYVFARKPI